MESTRKRLITLLANQNGDYISGQMLSDELNISRAAIWKHMKALEKDGYEIDAISNKGYRIITSPKDMSANTIQWGLETVWLGNQVIFEKEIDSTQIQAHKLAVEGATHGTVIVADKQTKGRGRLQRKWHSEEGMGIWMSVLLRPNLEPYKAPQLTLMAAVALAKTVEVICGVRPAIKWPNDIFLNDLKLAGILTEMQAEQDVIQYVIIGIGVNVNHDIKQLPSDINEIATSLKIETKKAWKRETLIQELLKQIEYFYEIYLHNGFSAIKEEWERRAYKIGENIIVTAERKQWEGTLIGIYEDGALLVQDQEKKVHRLYSAEINWRKGGS